jgi:hypothetical protein
LSELRELIHDMDDGSPDVATTITLRVMNEKTRAMREAIQDIVMAAVKRELTVYRRSAVRNVEDRAWAHGAPFEETLDLSQMTLVNPIEARQALLREKFFDLDLPGYVTWGEATAAQHRARAKVQRTLADHEYVARQLERHEARNLNELNRQLQSA